MQWKAFKSIVSILLTLLLIVDNMMFTLSAGPSGSKSTAGPAKPATAASTTVKSTTAGGRGESESEEFERMIASPMSGSQISQHWPRHRSSSYCNSRAGSNGANGDTSTQLRIHRSF